MEPDQKVDQQTPCGLPIPTKGDPPLPEGKEELEGPLAELSLLTLQVVIIADPGPPQDTPGGVDQLSSLLG